MPKHLCYQTIENWRWRESKQKSEFVFWKHIKPVWVWDALKRKKKRKCFKDVKSLRNNNNKKMNICQKFACAWFYFVSSFFLTWQEDPVTTKNGSTCVAYEFKEVMILNDAARPKRTELRRTAERFVVIWEYLKGYCTISRFKMRYSIHTQTLCRTERSMRTVSLLVFVMLRFHQLFCWRNQFSNNVSLIRWWVWMCAHNETFGYFVCFCVSFCLPTFASSSVSHRNPCKRAREQKIENRHTHTHAHEYTDTNTDTQIQTQANYIVCSHKREIMIRCEKECVELWVVWQCLH